MSDAPLPTADLADTHGSDLRVCDLQFRQVGGGASSPAVHRPVMKTTACSASCADAGAGAVLVVDGRGSLRTALVGDLIARAAQANGWAEARPARRGPGQCGAGRPRPRDQGPRHHPAQERQDRRGHRSRPRHVRQRHLPARRPPARRRRRDRSAARPGCVRRSPCATMARLRPPARLTGKILRNEPAPASPVPGVPGRSGTGTLIRGGPGPIGGGPAWPRCGSGWRACPGRCRPIRVPGHGHPGRRGGRGGRAGPELP